MNECNIKINCYFYLTITTKNCVQWLTHKYLLGYMTSVESPLKFLCKPFIFSPVLNTIDIILLISNQKMLLKTKVRTHLKYSYFMDMRAVVIERRLQRLQNSFPLVAWVVTIVSIHIRSDITRLQFQVVGRLRKKIQLRIHVIHNAFCM